MYEVIVMYDPYNGRRLKAPKSFKCSTREEAQKQASHLRKQGLKKHQFEVWLRD